MLKKLPESMLEKMLIELRKTNIPVFIWGGEKLAGKIWKYLYVKGIMVDGFLINKKYWNDDVRELCGRPVYVLEEYLIENKCDLIVGFGGYNEKQAKTYMSNIHKLYAVDFIGTLCMEEYDSSIPSDFVIKNREKLEWLENHLFDEKSRKALEEYLLQRISGVYVKDEHEHEQYFPNDIIHLQEKEVFIDCGAYHGESTIDFIQHLNHKTDYQKIICFEADRNNYIETKDALKKYKNVEIMLAGVWDREDIIHINIGHGETSRISKNGNECVTVKTIDGVLNGEKVTYIKMDIEGSELKALHGSAKTIKKYKPKLAICIYHRPEDLIEIPRYIYSLRNDYRFYIRNHSPYGIETVLYAV